MILNIINSNTISVHFFSIRFYYKK